MKMGFLLNFLGYKKVDIGAKTNFDIDSKIQSTVKYDETKLDRSEILDMTDTIKENTKKIHNAISVLKLQNYRFFIIVESISAKSLLYQFDQQTIVDQNLNINLRRIAQLNENIDWDTKQEYQVKL